MTQSLGKIREVQAQISINKGSSGLILFLVALCVTVLTGYVLNVNWTPSAAEATPAVNAGVLGSHAPQVAPSFGFTQVAKKAMPAVVSIQVKQRLASSRGMGSAEEEFLKYFFGQRPRGMPRQDQRGPETPSGQGSGFIISEDGYILTNNHVVGKADQIEVKLNDGRTFDAELIGTDEKSDVAIIRIKGDHLPVLKIGSSDRLEIGEWVAAIGNPFGLSATLTVGVVSAKGRANMGITDYEDFIQTDAAINPGNSGGPLVNTQGEVVGINTAIYSRSGGYMGIGFAIPIQMALKIKEQLIDHGEVRRGQIGVYIQPLTPEVAERIGAPNQAGVLIADVMKDGPGDRGGIKAGDVVIEMNGKAVKSASLFRNKVALTGPGEAVKLKVIRRGKEHKLTITLSSLGGKRAPIKQRDRDDDKGSKINSFGFEVEALTPRRARQRRLDVTEGILITDVTRGSPAQLAGLKSGQVIISVNQKEVTDLKTFKREVKKSGSAVLLQVRGSRGVRFIVLSR